MSTFHRGDLIRATGTFTNAAGTAFDPTDVNVKYKDPGGNVTTLVYLTDAAVVKSATGVYYVDVDADEDGTWHVRFFSTSGGQAAVEIQFDVAESAF